jgi:PAS domain S-box-containing protein
MSPDTRKEMILVVEDEVLIAADIQACLRDMGYDVPLIVSTGEEAVEKTGELKPDMVLMDIFLKGQMNGITAAEHIRRLYGTPVVYLTAYSDDEIVNKAVSTEPFGYLIKPFNERELKTTIRMALYKHAMDQRVRESEERYRKIAELADDCIYIISRDYTVQYLNLCARRYLKELPEDPIGRHLSEIFPGKVSRHMIESLSEVFTTGKPVRRINEFPLLTGSVWFNTTLAPFTTIDQEVISVMGLSRDIIASVVKWKIS